MRKVFLAVIGIIVLALSSSEGIAAEAKTSSTPPNVAAGVVKAAPGRSAEKQVAAPAKAAPGASKNREGATGPNRDSPVLRLLWLLAGSSKNR